VVNVQGDEPLINGGVLDLLTGKLDEVGASFEMGTLARKLDPQDLDNPNVVKVVMAQSGRALYFSRAAIPFCRDPGGAARVAYWHHLGIYAYRPEVLLRLVALPPSELERVEKLEQLRALQHEVALKVIPTTFRSVGVDTPEDLEKVEGILTARDSPAAP
jgi:3-deoxy-manno-octulosonate cytidylyltransferase (CMP-KDO synthetase)